MKGRYWGINENMLSIWGVIAIVIMVVNAFTKQYSNMREYTGFLFAVPFIGALISFHCPCSYNADETGLTMTVLFVFRKRFLYDDLYNVSIYDRRKDVLSRGENALTMTVLKLVIADRQGKKTTYTQITPIDLSKLFVEPNESKVPAFIKLFEYVQAQLGRPAVPEDTAGSLYAAQPARPLIKMEKSSSDIVEYPPRNTLSSGRARAADENKNKGAVGYFMGYRKRMADLYQLLTLLILPTFLLMTLLDHNTARFVVAAAMIVLIVLLKHFSTDISCKFSAKEQGFSITVGDRRYNFDYREIKTIDCKVRSRFTKGAVIKLKIKKSNNARLVFYESSRQTSYQLLYDPGVSKPQLLRLCEYVKQEKEGHI